MNSKNLLLVIGIVAGMSSCQKSATSANNISLTASSTQVAVGETMSVTLRSNANASQWTVTPSSNVTQTFNISTQLVNYFKFSQAGNYTIGVRARTIAYDSTHQSLDSCWHHGGGDRGGCTRGIDSASVTIKVVN